MLSHIFVDITAYGHKNGFSEKSGASYVIPIV
jgi:hypothetical protein